MPKFEVSIELGNSAMSKPVHVWAALRGIAFELMNSPTFPKEPQPVLDNNGNTVGTYMVHDENTR